MTPGIYDSLSNMAYHAETEWVSSTMLKRLLPEHYGPEPTNRKNLWFGSAFHTTVLGGPSEPWAVHDFPTWDSKAAKEAAAAAELAGEIPVLARDVDQINAMADSLKSHSEASNLIYGSGGQSEVSVFCEVDSVPMRARFDRVTGDGILVDVKTTTEKPNPYEFARTVIKWGYDLSAMHYLDVAASVPEFHHIGDNFRIVWVCKEPPHRVVVTKLDTDFLDRGYALRDLALSRYLHPSMVDSYPGEHEPLTLSLPRWAEL